MKGENIVTKNKTQLAHICNKEDDIAYIKAKMESWDERMDDIHKALMGNGRPGLIEKFNKLEGGLKVIKYLFPSGLIISLIVGIIGIIKQEER